MANDANAILDYALKAAAVKRVTRQRKRVVFLVHAAEIFSALEPVVAELQRRSDRFELVFIALPRNYSGRAGECTGMEATFRFLHEKGLNPIGMQGKTPADLAALIRMAPDFIFRQTPWDHHIPQVFHSRLLTFSQLCYVPYGMGTIHKPEHQYNQPFHNICDFIFCESDYHFQLYAEHRSLGTLGVHLTGYPRFESFVNEINREEPWPWPIDVPGDMPRVIWAPHHSVEKTWLNYSTFMDYKDLMLDEARKRRISILFRPHPALAEKLVASGQMSLTDYDAYRAAFNGTLTSAVDQATEYIRTFAASDALITDGLGFFSEYLLTGKPMIRTFKKGAEAMNDFGNMCAEACRVVHDGRELRAALDELGECRYVDQQGDLRLERQRLLSEICGGASARVADCLEGG